MQEAVRSSVSLLTVVLDTNLLVSAFLTPGGETWEILRRAKVQRFVVSPAMLAEVEEVLLTHQHIRKKYAYTDDEVQQYCRDLLIAGIVVPVTTVKTWDSVR